MNVLDNISDISRNYYHYLFTHKNVKGVGVGYKFINGVETNELCIHVFVERKVSEAYLTCNHIIPKTYMGIKTDVIEVGNFKASASSSGVSGKYRPLKGGCSIYTKGATLRGTLGCIVVRKHFPKDKHFILSNNHILVDNNRLPLGTEVIQPTLSEGGKFETDVVAKLSEFKPIKFSLGILKPKNFVDCAIAELTSSSLISNEILHIGHLAGTSTPTLKAPVKKTGIKTGLTEGKITSIKVTMEVEFSSGRKALFSNQILASLKSLSGDSGSIVVDENNKAIGLLFGSDTKGDSLINDINLVLKELKVNI